MIHSSTVRESPMQSLETMFMADVNFIADHPDILRLLLRALGRTAKSPLKLMMATFIRRYEQRLSCVSMKLLRGAYSFAFLASGADYWKIRKDAVIGAGTKRDSGCRFYFLRSSS